MTQISFEDQYIKHNGASIPAVLFMSMAKNARTYVEAESYLISLMAHALQVYGHTDFIEKANEILTHHNVAPIPMPEDSCQTSERKMNKKSPADMAREKYQQLDVNMQYALLRNGLAVMADKKRHLINKKAIWIAVYHVVHDRLDGSMVKTDFQEKAIGITPDNWPDKFVISESTMANYAHYISYEDSLEAYYDMENNPFKEFCDALWDVLEPMILTSAYE